MKKLQTSYNNNANKNVKKVAQETSRKNLKFLIDLAMVAGDTKEPQSFKKAWDHPNPQSQRKWLEAIQRDEDMNKMHKSFMSPNCI